MKSVHENLANVKVISERLLFQLSKFRGETQSLHRPHFLTLKIFMSIYPLALQTDKRDNQGLKREERGLGATGTYFPQIIPYSFPRRNDTGI